MKTFNPNFRPYMGGWWWWGGGGDYKFPYKQDMFGLLFYPLSPSLCPSLSLSRSLARAVSCRSRQRLLLVARYTRGQDNTAVNLHLYGQLDVVADGIFPQS